MNGADPWQGQELLDQQEQMEMENKMSLWQEVFTTDPAAVKPITGKAYSGNSPKPYWLVQRATEVFGPCGIGWGLEVVNERFERLTDTDVLHVALVRVWYLFGNKRGEIEQMGQTKACYKKKDGGMMVDEDAPKKSVTDGLTKCLSLLGFAGDIFSGRWDDSKYIEQAAAITKERIEDSLTFAESKAFEVRALMDKRDIQGAAITLNTLGTNGEYDGEAKELVYKHLDSAIRSGIKAYDAITQATTIEGLTLAWKAAPKHSRDMLLPFATRRKQELIAQGLPDHKAQPEKVAA